MTQTNGDLVAWLAGQLGRYTYKPGWTFVLRHWTPGYLGWTASTTLDARLTAHTEGRGARLMAAVVSAGIDWRLSRVWVGTRARERQVKRQGGLSRSCPLCGVTPRDQAAYSALMLEFGSRWSAPMVRIRVTADPGAGAAGLRGAPRFAEVAS